MSGVEFVRITDFLTQAYDIVSIANGSVETHLPCKPGDLETHEKVEGGNPSSALPSDLHIHSRAHLHITQIIIDKIHLKISKTISSWIPRNLTYFYLNEVFIELIMMHLKCDTFLYAKRRFNEVNQNSLS